MPEYPPGTRPPEHRVDQRCDSCNQFDRHPRHIHLGTDGSVTVRHMDCCFNAGCPTGACDEALRESGNAHGDALTAHLESRHPGKKVT